MEGCVHWLHHFILWHVLAMEDANLLNPWWKGSILSPLYISPSYPPPIGQLSGELQSSYRLRSERNKSAYQLWIQGVSQLNLDYSATQGVEANYEEISMLYALPKLTMILMYLILIVHSLRNSYKNYTLTQCRIVVTMAFLCMHQRGHTCMHAAVTSVYTSCKCMDTLLNLFLATSSVCNLCVPCWILSFMLLNVFQGVLNNSVYRDQLGYDTKSMQTSVQSGVIRKLNRILAAVVSSWVVYACA